MTTSTIIGATNLIAVDGDQVDEFVALVCRQHDTGFSEASLPPPRSRPSRPVSEPRTLNLDGIAVEVDEEAIVPKSATHFTGIGEGAMPAKAGSEPVHSARTSAPPHSYSHAPPSPHPMRFTLQHPRVVDFETSEEHTLRLDDDLKLKLKQECSTSGASAGEKKPMEVNSSHELNALPVPVPTSILHCDVKPGSSALDEADSSAATSAILSTATQQSPADPQENGERVNAVAPSSRTSLMYLNTHTTAVSSRSSLQTYMALKPASPTIPLTTTTTMPPSMWTTCATDGSRELSQYKSISPEALSKQTSASYNHYMTLPLRQMRAAAASPAQTLRSASNSVDISASSRMPRLTNDTGCWKLAASWSNAVANADAAATHSTWTASERVSQVAAAAANGQRSTDTQISIAKETFTAALLPTTAQQEEPVAYVTAPQERQSPPPPSIPPSQVPSTPAEPTLLPSATLRSSGVKLAPIASKLPRSFSEFCAAGLADARRAAGTTARRRSEHTTVSERLCEATVRLEPDDFKRLSSRAQTLSRTCAMSAMEQSDTIAGDGGQLQAEGVPQTVPFGVDEEQVRKENRVQTDMMETERALQEIKSTPLHAPLPRSDDDRRRARRRRVPTQEANWRPLVELLKRKCCLLRYMLERQDRRAQIVFNIVDHVTGIESVDVEMAYLESLACSRLVRKSVDKSLVGKCEALLATLTSNARLCSLLARFATVCASLYGQGCALLALRDLDSLRALNTRIAHYFAPPEEAESPYESIAVQCWPLLSFIPVKDVRESLALGCGATVRTLADLCLLQNTDTHFVLAVLLLAPDPEKRAENGLQMTIKWACVPLERSPNAPSSASNKSQSQDKQTQSNKPTKEPPNTEPQARSLKTPSEEIVISAGAADFELRTINSTLITTQEEHDSTADFEWIHVESKNPKPLNLLNSALNTVPGLNHQMTSSPHQKVQESPGGAQVRILERHENPDIQEPLPQKQQQRQQQQQQQQQKEEEERTQLSSTFPQSATHSQYPDAEFELFRYREHDHSIARKSREEKELQRHRHMTAGAPGAARVGTGATGDARANAGVCGSVPRGLMRSVRPPPRVSVGGAAEASSESEYLPEALYLQLQRICRKHQLTLRYDLPVLFEVASTYVETGSPFPPQTVRFVSPVDRALYEIVFRTDAEPSISRVLEQTRNPAVAATAIKDIDCQPDAAALSPDGSTSPDSIPCALHSSITFSLPPPMTSTPAGGYPSFVAPPMNATLPRLSLDPNVTDCVWRRMENGCPGGEIGDMAGIAWPPICCTGGVCLENALGGRVYSTKNEASRVLNGNKHREVGGGAQEFGPRMGARMGTCDRTQAAAPISLWTITGNDTATSFLLHKQPSCCKSCSSVPRANAAATTTASALSTFQRSGLWAHERGVGVSPGAPTISVMATSTASATGASHVERQPRLGPSPLQSMQVPVLNANAKATVGTRTCNLATSVSNNTLDAPASPWTVLTNPIPPKSLENLSVASASVASGGGGGEDLRISEGIWDNPLVTQTLIISREESAIERFLLEDIGESSV